MKQEIREYIEGGTCTCVRVCVDVCVCVDVDAKASISLYAGMYRKALSRGYLDVVKHRHTHTPTYIHKKVKSGNQKQIGLSLT